MKCENIFCIYWSNNDCILGKITLDIQGTCQKCIYINLYENCYKMGEEKFYKNTKSNKKKGENTNRIKKGCLSGQPQTEDKVHL